MTASSSEPWTVLRLLEWTTDFFKSRGSESPRLDAEILLAHARDCERIELYTAFGEEPDEEQRIAFRELVRRRGEGVPVAQLVGFKEFYSIPIRVDENVLVPRPETEHLVIEAIDQSKRLAVTDRPLRILDIGTGSGAIAIALAKNIDGAEITAVDVSLPALEIARWNVDKQELTQQITLLQSDLFESFVPGETSPFDLIVSNPPYVSQAEYDELPATVRDHEPQSALLSGPSGTEIIERLLLDAPPFLSEGGQLMIELSPMIAEKCLEMASLGETWADAKLIKDLAQQARVLSVRH